MKRIVLSSNYYNSRILKQDVTLWSSISEEQKYLVFALNRMSHYHNEIRVVFCFNQINITVATHCVSFFSKLLQHENQTGFPERQSQIRRDGWQCTPSERHSLILQLDLVFHPIDFSSELAENKISAYYTSLQRFWTSCLVKLQLSITPNSITKTVQLFRDMGILIYCKEHPPFTSSEMYFFQLSYFMFIPSNLPVFPSQLRNVQNHTRTSATLIVLFVWG